MNKNERKKETPLKLEGFLFAYQLTIQDISSDFSPISLQ